jgi:hypothetical protein
MNPDEELARARARTRTGNWKVIAKSRRALEPLKRERAYRSLLTSVNLVSLRALVHQRLCSQRRISRGVGVPRFAA